MEIRVMHNHQNDSLLVCFVPWKGRICYLVHWNQFCHSDSEKYREKQQRDPPSHNSILRWARKNKDRATTDVQSRAGRPLLISEDKQNIPSYIDRYPRTCLRIAECCLGLQGSFIQPMFCNRHHLFPYKLHIVRDLERDYENRIAFGIGCQKNVDSASFFLDYVVFSDDCVFHLNGKVGKHNMRI